MKRIFCLGETLLDIIFRNDIAINSCPGGAMLNSAVSLGRAGMEVHLISEYGTDHTGDLITDFLQDNGVGTKYIYRFDEEQTGIALAFLNEQNESRYSFYKKYPEKRLLIDLPAFNSNDLLMFGSFYSVENKLRPRIIQVLEKARQSGSFLFYDPNIRSPHKKDMPSIIQNIRENIEYADVIRGSHEDFQTIFDLNTAGEVFNELPEGKTIVYTCNNKGIWVRYLNESMYFHVPEIETLSTVGAGDSFNAGLVCGLVKYMQAGQNYLTKEQWNDIISIASAFAMEVCRSYDNFISKKAGRSI